MYKNKIIGYMVKKSKEIPENNYSQVTWNKKDINE